MGHVGQFIINHWGLWVLLISILAIILINENVVERMRAKEVSPQEAVELLNEDKAIIIDLRDKDTWRGGHIINAIHARDEDFEQNRMDKYKAKTLILVCTKGMQAATLARKLKTRGFTDPLVLAGGITAWQNADLPLVKGK